MSILSREEEAAEKYARACTDVEEAAERLALLKEEKERALRLVGALKNGALGYPKEPQSFEVAIERICAILSESRFRTAYRGKEGEGEGPLVLAIAAEIRATGR